MNFFNVIEDVEDLAGSVVIGRYRPVFSQKYICNYSQPTHDQPNQPIKLHATTNSANPSEMQLDRPNPTKVSSIIIIIYAYDNFYRKREGGGWKMMINIVTIYTDC